MRFVCDVMLGKLAKYLRVLGFDTIYLRNESFLADQARSEDPPYFITRRRKALAYERTIYVKSEHAREQLKELREWIKPFFNRETALARCIACNMPLVDIEKEAVEHRVPEFVFHAYSVFKTCPRCRRIYWAGTHAENMADLIQEIMT